MLGKSFLHFIFYEVSSFMIILTNFKNYGDGNAVYNM